MRIEQSTIPRAVSRRAFLKGGLAVGAGMAIASPHNAFGKTPANAAESASRSDFPMSIDDDSYFAKPASIEECSSEIDVDIVVIGAGAAGVPAACAAADAGATVAVLQKSPRVYSHGIIFAGWNAPSVTAIKGATLSDSQINDLKAQFMEESGYGPQAGLLNTYFAAAPEAMEWHFTTLTRLGQPVNVNGKEDDLSCSYMVLNQVSIAHQAIADDYEASHDGLTFYYSTPAMQLVQSESDAVIGAIAQDRDGNYIRFNASKGVILATGGYGGNKELIARWLPGSTCFTNGCYPPDNTGDGAMMAIWAGADVAPLKSKKIDIRFRGNHSARTDIEKIPFLMVNDKGIRIGNENAPEMEHGNFVSMNPSESGSYYCIFDSKYDEWLESIGSESAILDEQKMQEYMDFPEPLLWEADTLEDLSSQIGVPSETLLKTCDRYSELAKEGFDSDFYKEPENLYEIATPPFYAMLREYTFGGPWAQSG